MTGNDGDDTGTHHEGRKRKGRKGRVLVMQTERERKKRRRRALEARDEGCEWLDGDLRASGAEEQREEQLRDVSGQRARGWRQGHLSQARAERIAGHRD